jgi:hypothetical protein
MGWKITQTSALADGIHLLRGWKVRELCTFWWDVTVSNSALSDGMEGH